MFVIDFLKPNKQGVETHDLNQMFLFVARCWLKYREVKLR